MRQYHIVKIISKIVETLEASVDYLLGKTKMELDKQALKRLEDIASLAPENRSFVLNFIDMALRDFKVKKPMLLKNTKARQVRAFVFLRHGYSLKLIMTQKLQSYNSHNY